MPSRLNISRRDFLNGVAMSLAAGTAMSPLQLLAKTAGSHPYYPPGLTGLRGSHPGSFEFLHARAMTGATFPQPKTHAESYDLVVVGGGISGLAAANFWRQRLGDDQTILVLDNHDDFGGHAKRNEFDVDGHHLIGYGGSQSIDSPGTWSDVSRGLLKDVGIDTERFYDYFDRDFFKRHNLREGIHFRAEYYGRDITLPNVFRSFFDEADPSLLGDVLDAYPISEDSRRVLRELLTSGRDYLPGLSVDEKRRYCMAISYTDFLRKHTDATDELITIIRDIYNGLWGFGFDALSVDEVFELAGPGTSGLHLRELNWDNEEPYIFHFPDGNASVARSIVRKLIPDAIPGKTQEDLVTAMADYSRLDTGTNNTRIRLNAPAIDVRHTADGKHVDVVYLRHGQPERVRARHVVMACYNRIIPHICPELPDEQVEAINFAVKVPLVYLSIAVRNWRAFANLGYKALYVPQTPLMYHFGLDFPVSMGDYSFAKNPDMPTILHGTFLPTAPGLTEREQHIAGRRRLYEMSFDDYETAIVGQLDGALSRGGFDVERDLAGITVNRWPHGYAYEYNNLYDPPEYNPDNGPHIKARQPIGRISIANSDSSALAYLNGAIDAADRAVEEQLKL